MDTPAVPMPKDSREREILERLMAIRDQLLLLKQDRTKYIRSQDVQQLYDQAVEQVKQLNDVRKGIEHSENRGMYMSYLVQGDKANCILTTRVIQSTKS
jgi:hypothetical protein